MKRTLENYTGTAYQYDAVGQVMNLTSWLKTFARCIILVVAGVSIISCGPPPNVDWTGGDKSAEKLTAPLWTPSEVWMPLGRQLAIRSSNSLVLIEFTGFATNRTGLLFAFQGFDADGTSWRKRVDAKEAILWKPEFRQQGKRILLHGDIWIRTYGASAISLEGFDYGISSAVTTADLLTNTTFIEWRVRRKVEP